jgi:MFS family permease
VAFIVVESRKPDPLLPLGLFKEREFAAANLVTFAVYAALSGALFLLPVQLQVVAGFSPVAAGAATLPITVVMLLLSARMGRLSARIGPRLPMTIGPIIAGLAMVWLTRVGAGATYLGDVVAPMLLFGLGLSFTVAPLTSTVLGAAPDHQAGIASAINNDIARVAGLLAVAVLPALAGITPAAYADPALLSGGFGRAALIAGVLCAAGGVLAFLTIRNPLPGTPADAEPPTGGAVAPTQIGQRPAGDPGVGCAACPVLAPHIRPR